MKNTWFEETFLQSLIEKAQNNIKYPNQLILSEKQADICSRYMNEKENSSDTKGGFIARSFYMEYRIDGHYTMIQKRGRYIFFYTHRITTNKQIEKSKEIKKEIDRLEDTLDILYENEENNMSKIERIENIIDELWNDYNETLKVK